MAAPTLKIRKDEDGGASVVGKVDGVDVVFATVNPSQIAELRFAQGNPQADDGDNGDAEGEGK